MSQLTQKTIVEATIRLVEQKTVKKITIRDIVEACGITRNTFYYYFHDIYEVLEYALAAGFERIGAESESFEDFLGASVTFCTDYQKVLYNLYYSVGYEPLADYLKKQIRPYLFHYLQSQNGVKEDEKLLCVLCEEAVIGTLMRWICDSRRTTDPTEMQTAIRRIPVYFNSTFSKNETNHKIEEMKDI